MSNKLDDLEVWLPVPLPEYAGCYEVSNLGRIRSIARTITRAGPFGVYEVQVKGGLLKPSCNKRTGHYVVKLSGECRKLWLVQQLVCLAFHGECPPNHRIRHLDGKLANNESTNLLYVPYGEAVRSVVDNPGKGWKAREDRAKNIIRDLKFHVPVVRIMEKYGVTRTTINYISRGLTWKHLHR